MMRKGITATLLMLFVTLLSVMSAEVNVSKFSFHWITTNQDDSSVFFTSYQDPSHQITTAGMQITTEIQEAFGVTYSTNRLGKHSISFSSDPLSNGSLAIPYELEFFYNGESFSTLEVGTEEDIYQSTVGTLLIKRGTNNLFTASILAMLKLGGPSMSIEDFPAGDFCANLKFEVSVE